ncbi:alkaline phosphatase PhoX [Streptomyces sp. KR55]|uniref:alkaline phosphatase PhoX n=1 Tax=Streptomyces sp. KR55 TaxID=3457425 RepID=UPI003FD1E0BB
MPLNRRELLSRSALAGAGVMLIGSVEALLSAPGAVADTAAAGSSVGYGPLVPDPKGVLALPEGFSYRILTRTGVTTLESGQTTPSNHDGTGAFAADGDDDDDTVTLLVNNHEIDDPLTEAGDPVPHVDGLVYDPAAAGGCTVVEVTDDSVREWVGIAGTSTNCAGGVTPWGTWLTCEETEDKAGVNGMTKDHGYVFEVDPEHGSAANLDPKPVKCLGRYAHEAVVVDKYRGHLYLTEDASKPNGLLYRWTPPVGFTHGPGKLRALADNAGVLEAFKCFDAGGQYVDDLSRATQVGTVYRVDWVKVPDRDAVTISVRKQFLAGEITRSRKLEGMWWGDGGAYFVSSYARTESPGTPHDGQVWFYDPRSSTITLKVLLAVNTDVSRDGAYDGPDNITVSPFGGLVIAEDGDGVSHLFGATADGHMYPIARNELNVGTPEAPEYSEFAGVTFSRDGRTLFANIQDPGILLAITGPWTGDDGDDD